jgi:hypothetical protein
MSERIEPAAIVLPAYAREPRAGRRVALEIRDHLWPWTAAGGRHPVPLRAATAGLAVVVTVAWILSLSGRIGSGATLGWWLGWSVTEILVRMDAKPYVKEGPWWGNRYRRAGWMDMICYVSFKNLLIGAGTYLCLAGTGALEWLRGTLRAGGWA